MVKQTAGRNALGEFAPKFAELNDMCFSERYGAVRSSFRSVTAAL